MALNAPTRDPLRSPHPSSPSLVPRKLRGLGRRSSRLHHFHRHLRRPTLGDVTLLRATLLSWNERPTSRSLLPWVRKTQTAPIS